MRAIVPIALLSVTCAAAPAVAYTGDPGAPDVGDRLFPGLGNGGYDVEHYRLDLRYATTAPVQPIPGQATITARATQRLSRFNLDFSGDAVDAITVDGVAAHGQRRGEELEITPATPLANGSRFQVKVSYVSGPRELAPDADLNAVVATVARDSHGLGRRGPAERHAPHLPVQRSPCRQGHVHDRRRHARGIDVRRERHARVQSHRGRPHAVALRDRRSDGDRADPAGVRAALRAVARGRRRRRAA